jgi:hypothetical protein
MPATSDRKPRLLVSHLLAWTAGCALGFAAYRGLTPDNYKPRFRSLALGYNLCMGMVLGTILTGCGLLACRRWRGDAFCPSLPGHWLLLLGLSAALANGAAIVVYEYHARPFDPPFPSAHWAQFREADFAPTLPGLFHQAVGWGLGAATALAFLWCLRHRLQRPWLLVFLVAFVGCATLSGGRIFYWVRSLGSPREYLAWGRLSGQLYAGFMFLGAVAILAAIAWDVRRRARTDGLHQLGIAVWLAIAVIQIVTCYLFFHL